MAPDRADLDFCASITRRGGSNLWLVSRSLPRAKRDLFAASYASMRYLDDFVDEQFQSLEEDEKARKQAYALELVDSWEQESLIALSGIGTLDPDHAIAPVFRALQLTARQSNIPSAAWTGLATAMRGDIQNTALQSWQDFYSYADGATVCPTAVYLYILLCQENRSTGQFHLLEIDSLFHWAREMALFCYLIHIIRDLRKDATVGGRLLTIPEVVLQSANVNSDGPFSDRALALISQSLLEKASHHREQMRSVTKQVRAMMAPREALVFDGLIGIYLSMHSRLLKNPSESLGHQAGALEKQARSDQGLDNQHFCE